MNTYILQFNPTENRQLIDTFLHSNCEQKDETEAKCWLEAKQNFGFPLTSFQYSLLY